MMAVNGRGKQAEGVAGQCPICGQPRAEEYRPFCSKRCADVDLGYWLTGRYAIPAMEDDDEDGGNSAAPENSEGGA